MSMIPIVTFTFELWPPKSKSIGFTMVNKSAKCSEEAQNGLACISFTTYFHKGPLWPWPLTPKIKRVHPLTMINISTKFDEEIYNGLVSFVFTRLSPYMSIVTLTFHICPPKSIGYILNPWLTCLQNLIKTYNGLVSIMFTSLFSYMSIVTLDLWNPKSIGFILSSWLTCLQNLTKKLTMV